MSAYIHSIVTPYLRGEGVPEPQYEYRFCDERKWRFDLAWPTYMLALEVQGGIWTRGRHTRGVALLAEWEKLNAAACLGWRVLFCQPRDLCTSETVATIRAALRLEEQDR